MPRDVQLFAPEIGIFLTALLVFLLPLMKSSYRSTRAAGLIGGAASLVACIATLGYSGEPFFPGIYRVDLFSQWVKAALVLGLLAALVLMREPRTIRESVWGESLFFVVLSTAGTMMLVSATELLTMFVAMELAAFPLYAMAALHRHQHRASEGAVKYMLQGVAASAATVYGMSFLYGLSGTTHLGAMAARAPQLLNLPLFQFGLVLTLSGFLFKLALFPFHFWAPDAYDTAPHEATSFLATASKIAAAAVLCRLLVPVVLDSMSPGATTIRTLLFWACAVAMTVGNLAALVQSNLKRLLGYSAVAHAGYLLIGLQTGTEFGISSVLFYAAAYAAIVWLCFVVVCEVSRDEDSPTVASLAGLHKRSPVLALALLVGVFGLTGLPPTAGFIGKWQLFVAAMERGQIALVLVAAINSVIALGYYLRLLRSAYYDPPTRTDALSLRPLTVGATLVAIALVMWMGTAPGSAWSAAQAAARALLVGALTN